VRVRGLLGVAQVLYNFATPSTMKPTQMDIAKGALNQLPPWATVR
jgi:hypothetical protein